jgi:hypothetical protein
LAGASWSFDRAAANLKEFCGLGVCDNTIRAVCQTHGGSARDWQRLDPVAGRAFGEAAGDCELQTDGTMVNTTRGWREMRLTVFAKRGRGPAATPANWAERDLPPPRVRVIQAGIRTGEALGPSWRRSAARLGIRDASALTVLADGARWIWKQVEGHLPGAEGVLDIYHASEHLWAAAHAWYGEGATAAGRWVERCRGVLLAGGAARLVVWLEQQAVPEAVRKRLCGYFGSHRAHTDYRGRLGRGQSIGSGLVEGACKQVIGRRLKQTGARWKVRRVERMATLCALLATDQWQTYWDGAT